MPMNRRTAGKTMLATALGGLAPAGGLAALADQAPEERLRAHVCVIGGGSGGIGAAAAAARAGADVVLLERESILGGTSTMAWIHTWEPVAGANGVPRELYEMMKADPAAVVEPDYDKGSPRRGGKPLPFEPRALAYAARELLDASGRCRTMPGTTFYRARVQGDRVTAIDAWFSGRRLAIEADVFLDCTADGDVAADAGCEFHLGEDPQERYAEPSAPKEAGLHLNACTLVYRIKDTGVRQRPYLPPGVRDGLCPRPVCIRVMPNGDHLLNAVDMIDGNMLLAEDFSRLMHEAHRRVLEHFHWVQTAEPRKLAWWKPKHPAEGYATWSIVGVAPRIGVRESRRILGDYVLTENDCRAGLAAQKHPDVIATADHAVDVHGRKSKLYEVPNGPYGVPYRCLLPRGVRNLMIASRAASFSHIGASSCRLSRTMMMLGQAAGNAAAWCVKHHAAPREVNVAELQAALRSQGAAGF